MRYIDAFNHFFPKRYYDALLETPAGAKDLGKRVRGIPALSNLDERLKVALNDVDICLRLRQRGYLIVYTPFALLYHHESGTRGRLHPPKDEELVWAVWGDLIRRGDPYYNPNLTLSRTDWSLGV